MRLDLSTWSDVDTYLRDRDSIIIPIGSHEQHGPNGMIGTDIICPETIARALPEDLGIMVGPSIPVGNAQHHMAFPGSVTLRPSTLMAVITDYVESLAHHGFRRFVFLNGHGGNIATVNATFSELHARRTFGEKEGPLDLHLHNWFLGRHVGEVSRKLYGRAEGMHATPSEVSVTFHAYPDHARLVDKLEPEIAPIGPIGDAQDYRRRFPDGRIGSNPALSRIEHGAELVQASVADVVEGCREKGMPYR